MNSKVPIPVLNRLVDDLCGCLTPESAKRLLNLRADPKLQLLVDELGEKCSKGTLTEDEKAEYADYVSYATFIALLKSKARKNFRNERRLPPAEK